jgi:opacity protein-like surface antigen
MKSRIALLVPASILVFAAAASAQLRSGTVELNPFGGWLFGGEIAHVNDFNEFDRHTHVDVSDDAAYGGRIGYNFTSMFQLEAEYSHTDTNFVLRLDNAADQTLGDLKVDYFMSYATFNFGHRRVVPFFTIGAGAANLVPNVAGTLSTSEVRFTTAAGGGVKVFLCPWFAFRFDGRLYETYLGDHSHVLCDNNGFCNTRTWLPNVTTTGGFLFAF